MTKIFISYRRADSKHVTHTFYLLMRQHFGNENVFLDVDDIPVGVDFRQYLADEIAKVDVVLVVIGQQWDEMMRQRASQANDFVRIEVESALKQGKIVIPVLVMDAEMPDFSTLPNSIEALQWINASVVRELPDMERDCERLTKGIERALPKFTLPDLHWINIPAGKVTLEAGGYVPKGGQTFDVPAFAIAKYPVTNKQYVEYVKETGKEPQYWNDSDYNNPMQPVMGVTWYDAIAFCEWLIQKTGDKILLPSEQQWQRAAQGDDSRKYPWGNQWDASRCNNCDNDIDITTPVTAYEGKGDSPYGVVDMSGNVGEWCLTEWKTGSNEAYDGGDRVLRGGSVEDIADTLRSALCVSLQH